MDLDASQAGKCWLRFHRMILAEWLASHHARGTHRSKDADES
jgi:hypothetical protein